VVVGLSDCVPVFNGVGCVQIELTYEDVHLLSTKSGLVVLKSTDFSSLSWKTLTVCGLQLLKAQFPLINCKIIFIFTGVILQFCSLLAVKITFTLDLNPVKFHAWL